MKTVKIKLNSLEELKAIWESYSILQHVDKCGGMNVISESVVIVREIYNDGKCHGYSGIVLDKYSDDVVSLDMHMSAYVKGLTYDLHYIVNLK